MKEDFLHYLWNQGLYANQTLLTSTGETVSVMSAGEHNTNAGPDFLNAKIKISDTLWAGNVEIHVKASDWYKHKHYENPAYDNVILHVVAQADTITKRQNDTVIPTLEISVSEQMHQQYLFLMNSKDWVACESFIKQVDDFTILQWKESLMVQRLAEKSTVIQTRFEQNNQNWEETFYQTLAYNFGFKVNAVTFEMLAQSLPLKYLAKHKDDIQLLEALLFGQSGLIPENNADTYCNQLKQDYKHLKAKFSLHPLSHTLWKFMRMRPGNFPTIRIAQFAQLIFKSSALLSKILEIKTTNEIFRLFNIGISDYWLTHYTFTSEAAKKEKHFGKFAVQNVLINTVAPFLFFYGSYHRNAEFTQRALDFLQQIPAEKNKITKHWSTLGLHADSAFDSQALIQLKNTYCNHRKCLNCRIGNQVIQHNF